MSIFKCKMCGGNLEVEEGITVAECEYCGTKQPVPKAMDENLQNLFNRANTLRIKSEFDKAEKLYEKIIQADSEQSEAYWGLILCKYGIEYVDDPATFKKIPTCHRASYDSIIADDDYKSALEYADLSQRALYEEQAKEIDRIQKEILALAQKEETYDVFICYKETDSDGKRTQDSVIANDIYYQLKNQGFKVFYAAITLEGKLGSAYEPIIFAALNSAKVMLSIGTKPEYFNAVWVKNEWSRFLKIIQKDRSKLLIPCYRDMDAYELPEEFAHLQAQDMSKIGFINDLVRGIEKVVKKDEPKQTVIKETVVQSGSSTTAPLLKRAFMFLEDGDWASANEYCEKVLDLDPECAEAYLGKLMAELKVKKRDSLKDCAEPFDDKADFQKAVRFGNDELKTTLNGYIDHIKTRNENARLEGLYVRACNVLKYAVKSNDFRDAAVCFEEISTYKDSTLKAKDCLEKAKEVDYMSACRLMKDAKTSNDFRAAAMYFEDISAYKDSETQKAICLKKSEEAAENERKEAIYKKAMNGFNQWISSIDSLEDAINKFQSIIDYKDSAEKIELCKKKIQKIKEDKILKQKRAKRNKKIRIIAASVICVIIAFVIVLNSVIIPNKKYNEAVALMNEGKYTEAISALEELDWYKDSSAKIAECKYLCALELIDQKKYIEAYETLIALDGYKDSFDKANSAYFEYEVEKLKAAKTGDYVFFGSYEQDNDTSNGKENIEWLVLEKTEDKALVISKYALDCKPYNNKYEDTTWEECTLRSWLNNDFLGTAFSNEEKVKISTVTVSADWNPIYDTDSGNATEDKVFLLSINEVNKYFSSNSARKCQASAYAKANGAYVASNGNSWWWLRLPGLYQNRAAFVYSDGVVRNYGYDVNDANFVVRPALWISLES